LRRDDREYLVLLGVGQDVLLEGGTQAPPATIRPAESSGAGTRPTP
jgi:hypothetical protein